MKTKVTRILVRSLSNDALLCIHYFTANTDQNMVNLRVERELSRRLERR